MAVAPEVPQGFERLTYTGWAEEGITTVVHHAHAGFSYQNRLTLKAHFAAARGTNERTWMADQAESATPDTHHDGRMDVFVLESHLQMDRFGQVGVSGAVWQFRHGFQVHHGIGWALDWTAGGREMGNKYLGPNSRGHGLIAAIAVEYDVSLARVLRYPASRSMVTGPTFAWPWPSITAGLWTPEIRTFTARPAICWAATSNT